jgi:hypothetical protein
LRDLRKRNEGARRAAKNTSGPATRKREEVFPLDIWPTPQAPGYLQRAGLILAIPKVFSFIENPSETIRTLAALRTAAANPKTLQLTLDYSRCDELDLCASVVQDVLALRGKEQAKRRLYELKFPGVFSKVDDVNLLLVSQGILKQLGHPIAALMRPELKDKMKFADLRIGKSTPPHLTSEAEVCATELTFFFDECLRTEGYRLADTWKAKLTDLISEVLDNCEQHGRKEDRWQTIGYYSRSDDRAEGGECHIVLFNFGDTIYESLNRDDTSAELKKQIGDLAKFHQERGFFAILGNAFGIIGQIWQEESLWTLYALQEGVSRFRNTPDGFDRGNGTVKMIEFFMSIASPNPKMAIVSGRTHILFDGTYVLKPKDKQGEPRKVIAFNRENDLNLPPDSKYVRTLSENFPGTLVSLRFRLRKTDLQMIRERLNVDGSKDS